MTKDSSKSEKNCKRNARRKVANKKKKEHEQNKDKRDTGILKNICKKTTTEAKSLSSEKKKEKKHIDGSDHNENAGDVDRMDHNAHGSHKTNEKKIHDKGFSEKKSKKKKTFESSLKDQELTPYQKHPPRKEDEQHIDNDEELEALNKPRVRIASPHLESKMYYRIKGDKVNLFSPKRNQEEPKEQEFFVVDDEDDRVGDKVANPPNQDQIEKFDQTEVEGVIATRFRGSRMQLLIKWRGKDVSKASWVMNQDCSDWVLSVAKTQEMKPFRKEYNEFIKKHPKKSILGATLERNTVIFESVQKDEDSFD